jgi:hypothetical protein
MVMTHRMVQHLASGTCSVNIVLLWHFESMLIGQ